MIMARQQKNAEHGNALPGQAEQQTRQLTAREAGTAQDGMELLALNTNALHGLLQEQLK